MTTAPALPATERAVVAKVEERTRSKRRDGSAAFAVGIRNDAPDAWSGPTEHTTESGWTVTVAPCSSVLAVLDAFATWTSREKSVLAIVTDVPEADLGDAVLARLDSEMLHDADRYTLLQSVLGSRIVDRRIQRDVWLVDALLDLAAEKKLRRQLGTDLTRRRALSMVATDRLGQDPESADLADLILRFDESSVRARWREREAAERAGLREYLVFLLGDGAGVLCDLAQRRDDVLADLLVLQAVLGGTGSTADIAYGRATQSRFGMDPARSAVAALATQALEAVRLRPSEGVLARASAMLDELAAPELVIHSPLLPRGYTERLALAAHDLSSGSLEYVREHDDATRQPHRYDRLHAGLRLRRWLATEPETAVNGIAEGLTRHAQELSWVDRALHQVHAGDPDERVRATLRDIGRDVVAVRAQIDVAFARRLAAAGETPTQLLAVETFLAKRVASLRNEALVVVVDGMSGAVAGDLTDALAGQGWTEATAAEDGGREAVLAVLPTETEFSRSSLLRGRLVRGKQDREAAEFGQLEVWRGRSARLLHKAAVKGDPGWDIGPELDEALAPDSRCGTVAVVLNAVDDALGKGRSSSGPEWTPDDIPGLTQVLGRARETGRFVLLVSDHGHVLENGSVHRPATGGGARWRPENGAVEADEVLVSGPRVLTESGRAVLAAVEGLRYGKAAAGYHGGATLAEVAIPLIGLVPPGAEIPDGWSVRVGGAPAWWDGHETPTPEVVVPAPSRKQPRRKAAVQEGDGLFDAPAAVETPAPAAAVPTSRGQKLIAGAAFRQAHSGAASRSVPEPAVFASVVDLVFNAGGRAPASVVAAAAGRQVGRLRGLITVMAQVLNRDSYPVISLVDGGAFVAVDRELLDRQFPT
ncbi:BREX-2 system phosphatase PglZ [Actinomycetospora sp. NBRC 106378]|uniref:BREX-2 system phosphatase PglZ n=1 Tax=Actinomycetospora sp. NBRC 106378 TaxID=3032208 RepID=UPI0024A192F3|nr:BREX-2 system phosphatase PglZ [Actinomycetospora sp. NBRC 106378]GLZ51339.1 hypothetical protein Acsp07_09560 [Actinomycetospora sp. NBRC 106378]